MKTEQEVLKLNNLDKSLDYCKNNKDANVKLHEDIIVNSKNALYAYYFALDIVGANIERLQEIVINSGNSCYIYNFAKYVENSNKEELFRTLLKIDDEFWINKFIENIPPLSEELKTLVIFI